METNLDQPLLENKDKEGPHKSAYEKASLFQKLHFIWALPLVRHLNSCSSDKVTLADIPKMGNSESAEYVQELITRHYEEAIRKGKKTERTLFAAVLKSQLGYLLLSVGIQFNQVIIFVKTYQRAEVLNKILQECKFPSAVHHGSMKQEDR